jgi:hypothetical protein
VSARLTTLEGSCVKSALHDALNSTVGKLSLQVCWFSVLSVKWLLSQTTFQIKIVDLNGISILCHITSFLDSEVLFKIKKFWE